jgi:hypothetical protein
MDASALTRLLAKERSFRSAFYDVANFSKAFRDYSIEFSTRLAETQKKIKS